MKKIVLVKDLHGEAKFPLNFIHIVEEVVRILLKVCVPGKLTLQRPK